MKRTIYIPGIERSITLGQLVKVVRTAKAHPNTEFKCGITCWWPCKGSAVVEQFLKAYTTVSTKRFPTVSAG